MSSDRLAHRTIALLGIGHTNAHIVRMWGQQALPGTELVCVSDLPNATYSGMLPAVLAGQLAENEMQIDLVRLCGSVGARLILESPVGLDRLNRELLFADRPPLHFDALSIGIGSIASVEGAAVDDDLVLNVKPMQTFSGRLKSRLESISRVKTDEVLSVTIVGGGAASVELAFCLPAFLSQCHSTSSISMRLVARDDRIGSGLSRGVRTRVERELASRGIEVVTDANIVEAKFGRVVTSDGKSMRTDLVIWATGAAPQPLLKQLDLPQDQRGFLSTDQSLRSLSGAPIFAVGDSGSIAGYSLPKSGVYAVRQGPTLWQNLQNLILDKPLIPFRPQRGFLKLLNLGDGSAIGHWKNMSFQGRWVYRLKDRVDKRFLSKYVPGTMSRTMPEPMQCRGCGCKMGSDSLARSLEVLDDAGTADFRDDAVLVGDGSNKQLVSTDFFSTPFDDPYLSGRVTALHCSSDLLACGAQVRHAIANVVVPEGEPASQERWLRSFLAGASREFASSSAAVVGGHTIVGPRSEVGFTVFAKSPAKVWSKGALCVGDQLVLTKPLGIGVLLAAYARNLCSAFNYETVVACMLENQFKMVGPLADVGVHAATDVTGFGLAGHLFEMLDASSMDAEVSLSSLPLLPGASAAIRDGIQSSMVPANKSVASKIQCSGELRESAAYELLFDPQTCGGLLIGIPENNLDMLLQICRSGGASSAVRMGEVVPREDGRSHSSGARMHLVP